MIAVTPVFGAILACIYVFLAVRVIRLRRSEQIALGSAGNKRLERAIRVHGNFAEYVPISLLLLLMLELLHAGVIIVGLLGTTLLLGRCVHAWGVSQPREDFRLRVVGMGLSFATIVSTSLLLLVFALRGSP